MAVPVTFVTIQHAFPAANFNETSWGSPVMPWQGRGPHIKQQCLMPCGTCCAPYNLYSQCWHDVGVLRAVDYVWPADRSVSEDCKDLLSRLLVADPSQRITMAGIQQHPWFQACSISVSLQLPPVMSYAHCDCVPLGVGLHMQKMTNGPHAIWHAWRHVLTCYAPLYPACIGLQACPKELNLLKGYCSG